MRHLRSKVIQLGAALVVAFLLVACNSGVSGQSMANENIARAAGPNHVEQDPQLRITTPEVMALFAEVYGDKTLIKATLETNDQFLLVDARPQGRYQEGHIPGAIHLPPGEVAANLDQLPRDRQVIFYCGGLHCPLSTQAAKIAMEHGLTNVKVYYEGDPGWIAAGNYLISETPYVYHMVARSDDANFILVDSRPAQVHQKSFIPGSLSVPINQWDQKKSLLPQDLDTRLIFYCGGHGCPHSHNSAKAAKELGYKWVSVFSAGVPAWKAQSLPLWGNEPSGVATLEPQELPKVAPGKLSRSIGAMDFQKMMAEKSKEVVVLDVRSSDEYAAGHLPGAINLPDDQFYANYEQLVKNVPTDKQIVIHCVTGIRAEGVYHALATRGGYENAQGVQFLNAAINISSNGSFTLDQLATTGGN